VVVLSNDNTRERVAPLMINTPITINEFDNYLAILATLKQKFLNNLI
jgi:hypothetical protein